MSKLAVDFVVKRTPSYRVATRTLRGKWPGDRAMSKEFEKLYAWVRKGGLGSGKWFFRSLGTMDDSSSKGRWEVGIEVRGRAVRGGGSVSIKTFPATTVVAVKFDPKHVSPGLVYNAIGGWMRWSGRARKFSENGHWREVYSGNPWKSKSAWAGVEIQAPVKR
jgi:DNA gyrase inhibitor GyrI